MPLVVSKGKYFWNTNRMRLYNIPILYYGAYTTIAMTSCVIDMCEDINARILLHGGYGTLLDCAVVAERPDLATLIINSGADVDCSSGYPVSYATSRGLSNILRLLIGSGASVNLLGGGLFAPTTLILQRLFPLNGQPGYPDVDGGILQLLMENNACPPDFYYITDAAREHYESRLLLYKLNKLERSVKQER